MMVSQFLQTAVAAVELERLVVTLPQKLEEMEELVLLWHLFLR